MTKQKNIFSWVTIQKVSSLAGIISFVISVIIFLGINNIKDILLIKPEIDITLNESSIKKISGKSITIYGSVLLKESKLSALPYLKKENIDLYPIARCTIPQSKWRVCSRPIIKDDGELFFSIDLSNFPAVDSSNTMEVILISGAHELMLDGFEFQNLLPYLNSASNLITTSYY